MGRATIVSGGADGRYTINLDYGTAQRDAMVAKLTATINELETRKAWQQELVDGFQGGLESLQPEFDALVIEYVALSRANPQDRAAMDAKKAQLDKKTAEIIKQQAWLDSSKADLGMTEAGIKAATAERGAIQTAEVSEQRQAWCADLTESATGAVATLEIPGESALILIQPGAPAPTAIHGALTAREVMSPAQAYWNAAVLPGWQKFKPTYRWGTITALDQNADKCTVELAEAKSSAQRMNVNQAATLKDVPIVYMECNAGVFAVGDRVVVSFTDQDWTKPKVIGFVDTPRACAGAALYCIPADDSALYGWSPPVLNAEGNPINGGKGGVAVLGNLSLPTETGKDGTNRTAGVAAGIAGISTSYLTPRTVRGVRADVAGLPAHGPTELGNNDDQAVFTSIGRASFEWVSKTNRHIATAFDTCKVNGRDIGRPPVGTPYRVFVPDTGLTGGTPTAFCITEQFGDRLHLYSRPLAGDAAIAWTFVSTIVLSSFEVTPPLTVGDLKKLITNDSASVVTGWFARGLDGLGCLDFNIPAGTHLWTPATKTFSKNYDTTDISIHDEGWVPVNPHIDTFTAQFSVDYVGNVKTFATITGTRTHHLVQEEGPDYSWSTAEGSVHELIIADFWGQSVTIADYLWTGSANSTAEIRTGIGGELYSPGMNSTETIKATLQSRNIYYFGGAGDPILFTFKNYGETTIKHNYSTPNTPSDGTYLRTGYLSIPPMKYGNAFMHGGTETKLTEWDRPGYTYSYSPGVESPPTEAGSVSRFMSTWREGEYAHTEWTAPVGIWTPGAGTGLGLGTISDVLRWFQCLFVPDTPIDFSNRAYHSSVTNYKNGVNLRATHGLSIFSNPTTAEGNEGFFDLPTSTPRWPVTTFPYPPDSTIIMDLTKWHTWCSDSGALSRFAIDLGHYPPTTARLKYLQLISAR